MIEKIEEKCSVEDCDKPLKSKGLCDMHYARLRRYGSLERKTVDHSNITVCLAFGCENKSKTSGLCDTHYSNLKRIGTPYLPKVIRLCSVEGCYADHLAKGLCQLHYNQWKRIIDKNKLQNHLLGVKAIE